MQNAMKKGINKLHQIPNGDIVWAKEKKIKKNQSHNPHAANSNVRF